MHLQTEMCVCVSLSVCVYKSINIKCHRLMFMDCWVEQNTTKYYAICHKHFQNSVIHSSFSDTMYKCTTTTRPYKMCSYTYVDGFYSYLWDQFTSNGSCKLMDDLSIEVSWRIYVTYNDGKGL